MAITFESQGTTPTATGTGTGSTSISPDLPSGVAAGNMLVMFVGAKPDTATIVTPSGWTAVTNGNVSGGGGTTGTDAGPTRCAAFTRVADGADSAPTVSVTSGNSSWAQIFRYSSSLSPPSWEAVASGGTDVTTGTAWSVTCAADPGLLPGDQVIVGSTIPTDVSTPTQFSAESVSATTATFGTVTELSEPESTTGQDIGGFIFDVPVTGGPSTAAPVITATAGGTTTNVQGVSVLLAIRDYPPVITDDFNRANSSGGLGTSTSGHTWIYYNNIVGITSNTAYRVGGSPQAGFDTKHSNGTISLKMAATSGLADGIVFRGQGGASGYNSWYFRHNGSGAYELGEYQAPTATNYGTGGTPAVGDILTVSFNGTNIRAYLNGSLLFSVTSSVKETNVWHGFRTHNAAFRADDYSFQANAVYTPPDTGSGTESGTVGVPASDTGTGLDTESVDTGATPKTDSDTASGSESETVTASLASTDVAVGTENAAITATTVDSDTGSATEAVSARAFAEQETGTGVEGQSLDQGALPKSDADTGSGVEAEQPPTAALPDTDTGAGAETHSTASASSDADTGAGSEQTLLIAQLSDPDAGSGSETAPVSVSFDNPDSAAGNEDVETTTSALSAADTGSGTEVPAIAAAGADTAAGGETGAVAASLAVSDTAAGTEMTTAFSAVLASPDSAMGTDAAATTASDTEVDVGAGVDAETLGTLQSDTGTGADSGETIAFANSDTGVSLEAHAALAAIPGADSATGTESTLAGLSGADTGAGVETFAVSVILAAQTDTATAVETNSPIQISVTGTDTAIGVEQEYNETRPTGSRVLIIAAESRDIRIPERSKL